jgi:transcriptional regulator with XRE-family HTH domain
MVAGERLRKAREKLGKSQADVAAEVGVKQPTVFEWETGKCFPSHSRIPKVAKAYGVDRMQLLSWPRGLVAA